MKTPKYISVSGSVYRRVAKKPPEIPRKRLEGIAEDVAGSVTSDLMDHLEKKLKVVLNREAEPFSQDLYLKLRGVLADLAVETLKNTYVSDWAVKK